MNSQRILLTIFTVLFVFLVVTATIFGMTLTVQAEASFDGGDGISTDAEPVPFELNLFINRTMTESILNTSNQMVFGPQSCIAYGDPFSPLNSPWEPDLYTYTYRILVPGEYAHNTLRVEIFDPDSINQVDNAYTISYTDRAIDRGFNLTETMSCTGSESSKQINPCLIETGELELLNSEIGIDEVNPFWFVRVDENRGDGPPPGNGNCKSPSEYSPAYNTQTLYKLYYYEEDSNGNPQRVDLAQYTGQVGDGVRDLGDHQTDMRWVSPGGSMSYDQVQPVPVDPSSEKDFELDIVNDLSGILTDASTGDRYVYLDVTAISGSSENGFEIWAGPANYTETVPSEVNARNLKTLNEPGAHSSEGVAVFGLGRVPMNSNYGNMVDIPLAFVGSEFSGSSIFANLYDSDSGAEPPITFYFNSIPESDWSLTFGMPGEEDPDGVTAGSRCLPGSCGSQWVDLSYEIAIPVDICSGGSASCTPFTGGVLMARYAAGFMDSYVWELSLPDDWLPLPDTPILNPVQTTTVVDTNYTVSWLKASYATHYRLEEATDANFTNPTTVYEGPLLSWSPEDKRPCGSPFFFRVKAINAAGESEWSNVESVETSIAFTHVPPYGSNEKIEGEVCGVNPDEFKVAVYIFAANGWWNKPFWAWPLTDIQPDGTWKTRYVTGGVDQYATQFAAFLLPMPNGQCDDPDECPCDSENGPPCRRGHATLPEELFDYPHVFVTRIPPTPNVLPPAKKGLPDLDRRDLTQPDRLNDTGDFYVYLPVVITPPCPYQSARSPLKNTGSFDGVIEISTPKHCTTGWPTEQPIQVGGTFTNTTSGSTIWALAYAPNGLYYPQSLNACTGEPPYQERVWQVPAYLGVKGGDPEWFDIVVVLVDDAGNQFFSNHVKTGCNGDFTGITAKQIEQYNITEKEYISVQTKD